MAILRDDDVRFRHLSRKIGIFLLVAVAGLILTFVSIGINQKMFVPKTRIYFIADSGRDIAQGMAVKLSGFNIGRVKQLSLTEHASVRVVLEINDEYMRWVRADSKARLLKEGVIGDNVIEITPGTENVAELRKDMQIEFEREVGMGRLIDDLYGEIRPLIRELRSVMQRADTLLAELPSTRAKLDATLSSAQRNFENLEKITKTELPAAVRGGREAAEGSKKVVDSLSRTWPISNNVEQPKAGVLPLDSFGSSAPKSAPQK